MASVHRFPARDCWRIAYTLCKEGKKRSGIRTTSNNALLATRFRRAKTLCIITQKRLLQVYLCQLL